MVDLFLFFSESVRSVKCITNKCHFQRFVRRAGVILNILRDLRQHTNLCLLINHHCGFLSSIFCKVEWVCVTLTQ